MLTATHINISKSFNYIPIVFSKDFVQNMERAFNNKILNHIFLKKETTESLEPFVLSRTLVYTKYHMTNVPPLYSFSILCAKRSSFSVQSTNGFIFPSSSKKWQSGLSKSFVIKYVLWEDRNSWQLGI